jgi:Spy/CpxP family protein refolding chaperone
MKLTIARFAAVAALAAGMAFAQTPAAPLTPAQKEQARAIRQQARQTAEPLEQQLKTKREALAAAVKANDVAQIHSLAAQCGQLQGQLLGIRSEARAKVYSTLTPEQKAKADRVRQRLEKRRAGRG